MSSYIEQKVVINVTGGDCIDSNRTCGKSNTGTYFISSIKDFDAFNDFFKEDNDFRLDKPRLMVYFELFKKFMFKYSKKYKGEMQDFQEYIDFLLDLPECYPQIKIGIRQNDTRVFMKFEDNSNTVVDAFRHLLYENISQIVIEKSKDFYIIYPQIVFEEINKEMVCNTLIVDND